MAAAAEVLWQASGRIGAHRLQPFVPELLDRLLLCGELTLAPAIDKLVRQASRPTLARLLGPARARYPRRGATITRPGTVLRHEIPIRTFTEWTDARPGFLEVDLVAHCGTSTKGFYLCTLCAVDIATAWIELEAVWGKGQDRVGGAVDHVRTRLPMPWSAWTATMARVHQPLPAGFLPPPRRDLHPQPPVEEERQCPCRTEERCRRPPAHRL